MKLIYGGFQNYSFRYEPETFCFYGYYHKFDDCSEKMFVSGKIVPVGGEVFPQGVEPENKVDWPVDARIGTITYREGEEPPRLEIIFEIRKEGLSIRCSSNAAISGVLHWGEKISDVLPGAFNTSGNVLYGSSGPVVRQGDDMLFDRQRDRALRFVSQGGLVWGFNWEKNLYTFDFTPVKALPDNRFLFQVRENFVAQNMNMRYSPIDKNNRFPTPPVGWMTWYATRFEACEAEVLENTAKLKETFGKYTGQLVSWVDWEWYHQSLKGDGAGGGNVFSPCKDTYPNGLEYVSRKIKEAGVIPALWVGPTCEGNKNKWFEAHPECIIGPYPRWCGQWWVHPARKEVYEEYIPMVMKQVLDWGYEMVKWDCQVMTSYMWEEYWEELGSPDLSPEQMEHRIIAAGRKALGDDVYLLLCNPVGDSDISVGSDLCDAARIGGDIFNWDEFVQQAIATLFHFYPIHNTMLYADCDNIVIRQEYNTLPQARTRVSFYGLTGVPVTLGDRFREYDAQRIDMLSKIIPVVDMNPAEFSSKVPEGVFRTVSAGFERKFGSWQVAGITNTDKENTQEYTIDFASFGRLETGKDRSYGVYDFWNNTFIGVFEQKVTVQIPPADTLVLRITPMETDGLPVLVSSSRHITQGGYELLDMTRSVETKTVSGVTLCVPGEPCRLTFFVPEDAAVTACGGTWEQNGSCGILTLESADGGEISWSVGVK